METAAGEQQFWVVHEELSAATQVRDGVSEVVDLFELAGDFAIPLPDVVVIDRSRPYSVEKGPGKVEVKAELTGAFLTSVEREHRARDPAHRRQRPLGPRPDAQPDVSVQLGGAFEDLVQRSVGISIRRRLQNGDQRFPSPVAHDVHLRVQHPCRVLSDRRQPCVEILVGLLRAGRGQRHKPEDEREEGGVRHSSICRGAPPRDLPALRLARAAG